MQGVIFFSWYFKQQITLSMKRDLKCASQYLTAEKTLNKVERSQVKKSWGLRDTGLKDHAAILLTSSQAVTNHSQSVLKEFFIGVNW